MKLGLVVEGHGEVESVPILIRRIAGWLGTACEIAPPLRVPRKAVVKAGELERAVTLLANKVGADGAVLILLDADDDLACTLAPALIERARAARPDRAVGLVLAVREFEAWFLAAARSLRGVRGLAADLEPPASPESVRGAKEWLSERKRGGYLPTADQPGLTARFDIEVARQLPSFDKLVREVARLLAVPSTPPPKAPEPEF